MMNYEEAMATIDYIKEKCELRPSVKESDFDDLKQHITAMQAEIDRLKKQFTKVCGECDGKGTYCGHIRSYGDVAMECERCKGTGRIPRVVLPDWFVRTLMDIKMSKMDFKIANVVETGGRDRFTGKFIAYDLTKLPDGTWELGTDID